MGGRKIIIENLMNHHEKLLYMDANIKIKKPRPHVDAKKRKMGIKKRLHRDYSETYETFRTVLNGETKDWSVLKTLNRFKPKKKTKKKKKKKKNLYARNQREQFLNREHLNRLANQKRRMRQIGKK